MFNFFRRAKSKNTSINKSTTVQQIKDLPPLNNVDKTEESNKRGKSETKEDKIKESEILANAQQLDKEDTSSMTNEQRNKVHTSFKKEEHLGTAVNIRQSPTLSQSYSKDRNKLEPEVRRERQQDADNAVSSSCVDGTAGGAQVAKALDTIGDVEVATKTHCNVIYETRGTCDDAVGRRPFRENLECVNDFVTPDCTEVKSESNNDNAINKCDNDEGVTTETSKPGQHKVTAALKDIMAPMAWKSKNKNRGKNQQSNKTNKNNSATAQTTSGKQTQQKQNNDGKTNEQTTKNDKCGDVQNCTPSSSSCSDKKETLHHDSNKNLALSHCKDIENNLKISEHSAKNNTTRAFKEQSVTTNSLKSSTDTCRQSAEATVSDKVKNEDTFCEKETIGDNLSNTPNEKQLVNSKKSLDEKVGFDSVEIRPVKPPRADRRSKSISSDKSLEALPLQIENKDINNHQQNLCHKDVQSSDQQKLSNNETVCQNKQPNGQLSSPCPTILSKNTSDNSPNINKTVTNLQSSNAQVNCLSNNDVTKNKEQPQSMNTEKQITATEITQPTENILPNVITCNDMSSRKTNASLNKPEVQEISTIEKQNTVAQKAQIMPSVIKGNSEAMSKKQASDDSGESSVDELSSKESSSEESSSNQIPKEIKELSPKPSVTFAKEITICGNNAAVEKTVAKPLVCSIAIPLPTSILKSDKIPIVCSVPRRNSKELCSAVEIKNTVQLETGASKNKLQQQLLNYSDKQNDDKKQLQNNEQEKNKVQTSGSTPNEKDETKNLVNQETRFQTQLADLTRKLAERETDKNKLIYQMDELQRDVVTKAAGMERLQAELAAATKESEFVRLKLNNLNADLTTFRQKNAELQDELLKKTEEVSALEKSNEERATKLEATVKELTERVQQFSSQIENIKTERNRLEEQKNTLEKEREEERKIVQEALEDAMEERRRIDERWKKDFERLRTVNTGREQQLLDDFEWKLREIEQNCKRRLEEKDKQAEERIKEAQKSIEGKVKHAEDQLKEVIHLKSYEAEVNQLRGLTHDQQRSLRVMTEQMQHLQLTEENLKEEIGRLQQQVENEKSNLNSLKEAHKRELEEKDRKMLIQLEKQRGETAVQWEDRMRRECLRLKCELDQQHNEEKKLAIDSVRKQKEQEHQSIKQIWDKRLQDCTKEIATLKKSLNEKDAYYQSKLEKIQTNADRDNLELRRALDKMDMSYNDRIEKMTENHEREIERLTEDCGRRVKEVETNWQMQMASTRATLELVKEQLNRDAQDKLQALDMHHRSQLEHQWEQLVQDKEEALQSMEQKYRSNCDKLKDEIAHQQKSYIAKEIDLNKTIELLRSQLNDKDLLADGLQNNVDTLQGGMQVLNQEIAKHGQELKKMTEDTDNKIREAKEVLLAEQTRRLSELKEKHAKELREVKQNAGAYISHLQKKCQCLTKLFEEMKTRYEKRESRPEDLNLIADLRQVIAEQEKDLAMLTEEKRYYQLQLVTRQTKQDHLISNEILNSDSLRTDNDKNKPQEVQKVMPCLQASHELYDIIENSPSPELETYNNSSQNSIENNSVLECSKLLNGNSDASFTDSDNKNYSDVSSSSQNDFLEHAKFVNSESHNDKEKKSWEHVEFLKNNISTRSKSVEVPSQKNISPVTSKEFHTLPLHIIEK